MSLQANDVRFERNLGFFSVQEQQRLNDSTVAVAGAGGDGGMLAIQLARMGVGELRLADPDPFEAENINRQAACTEATLDVNKAVAVGDYISEINPDIKVTTYTEGITYDNAAEFVEGSDLLIDETEFTIPDIGVALARTARSQDVPNLMALNIGFGTLVTSYRPDGPTLEKQLGLSEEAPLEEIAAQEVPLGRWVPYLPSYIDMEAFKAVASGEKSAPSVAPGVAIAAGVAATQATLHLLGRSNNRPAPVYSPHVMSIDAMTGRARVVKHPKLSFARSIATIAFRTRFGMNPKTSY
jgi:molybdopterin/thiamine biosynthesis adenylyltransferase